VNIRYLPNPAMTTERRSSHFGSTCHDVPQLRHQVYLVAKQWCRVAWYIGCCLVMTVKLLLRIVLWMLRVLSPIPIPVGTQSRYAKRSTGLPIPAFDLVVVTFGAAVVIGHLW
jgi:hypothetical protein